MQIVIDIPEKMYHMINAGFYDYGDMNVIIQNGTPLPEHHGRLIDADELKKIIQENDILYMTSFNVRLCDINATPTIIEADKAESEDAE